MKNKKKNTNQFVYCSSISIPEVLNIATNYKKELKDRKLIDEPKTKFWNEQQIFYSQTLKMLIHVWSTLYFMCNCIGKGPQFTETLFKRNL